MLKWTVVRAPTWLRARSRDGPGQDGGGHGGSGKDAPSTCPAPGHQAGVRATTASTSTATPCGSEATPTALRAWRPASPNTSTIGSKRHWRPRSAVEVRGAWRRTRQAPPAPRGPGDRRWRRRSAPGYLTPTSARPRCRRLRIPGSPAAQERGHATAARDLAGDIQQVALLDEGDVIGSRRSAGFNTRPSSATRPENLRVMVVTCETDEEKNDPSCYRRGPCLTNQLRHCEPRPGKSNASACRGRLGQPCLERLGGCRPCAARADEPPADTRIVQRGARRRFDPLAGCAAIRRWRPIAACPVPPAPLPPRCCSRAGGRSPGAARSSLLPRAEHPFERQLGVRDQRRVAQQVGRRARPAPACHQRGRAHYRQPFRHQAPRAHPGPVAAARSGRPRPPRQPPHRPGRWRAAVAGRCPGCGWRRSQASSASHRVANEASEPTRSVWRAATGARIASVPWRKQFEGGMHRS